MSAPTDDMETRRKRLLWRATHRGTRELDLVVGGFVKGRLAALKLGELDALEKLIEVSDSDLQSWLTGEVAVPAHASTPLLAELLSFRP